MAWKPTIAVDLDGCLHSYTSGWKGPDVIADPPTKGALEWLLEASKSFVVVVHSSRNKEGNGVIDAMRKWFVDHFVKEKLLSRKDALKFVADLKFPVSKPPANMYIDDRGFRFVGRWPTVEEMRSFKPQRGVPAERRLSEETLAFVGVAKSVLVLLNDMHTDDDTCELNGATPPTCNACRCQRELVKVARYGS